MYTLYTLLEFQNDWILARERVELESWFIDSKYSFDLYLLGSQYEMLIQTPNNRPLRQNIFLKIGPLIWLPKNQLFLMMAEE